MKRVILRNFFCFYRLSTSYGRPGSKWNYSFDPCSPFSMPENPNEGFGDKCLSVAVSDFLKLYNVLHYNVPRYTCTVVFNIKQPSHGSQIDYFAICL